MNNHKATMPLADWAHVDCISLPSNCLFKPFGYQIIRCTWNQGIIIITCTWKLFSTWLNCHGPVLSKCIHITVDVGSPRQLRRSIYTAMVQTFQKRALISIPQTGQWEHAWAAIGLNRGGWEAIKDRLYCKCTRSTTYVHMYGRAHVLDIDN